VLSLAEYGSLDATGLAQLIARGEVTRSEVLRCAHDAIDEVNDKVNAVIEVYNTDELETVDGPFSGVPTLIKDIGSVPPGQLLTYGSRLGKGNVSEVKTHLLGRIEASGLVAIGRSASSEFAIAGATETLAYGATRSPWNLNHIAGGSSGGAGAAVGAGIVPIAHGSDGGGSIRIPASCCGVVGFKPSRGRISPAPFGDSLAGFSTSFVLTRSVRDAALALDLLSGAVPGDLFGCCAPEKPFRETMGEQPRKLRVAATADLFSGHSTDDEVRAAWGEAMRMMSELNHDVQEASPVVGWHDFVVAMAVMWAADTASFIDEVSSRVGRVIDETVLEPQTLAIYQDGKMRGAGDLLWASEVFNRVNRSLGEFFSHFDVLITPTLGQLPPPIGRYQPGGWLDTASFFESWADVESFLPLFNCSGQPAISIPLGISGSGLPIGVQVVGAWGGDATVLEVARQLEIALPWKDRHPPVFVGRS